MTKEYSNDEINEVLESMQGCRTRFPQVEQIIRQLQEQLKVYEKNVIVLPWDEKPQVGDMNSDGNHFAHEPGGAGWYEPHHLYPEDDEDRINNKIIMRGDKLTLQREKGGE